MLLTLKPPFYVSCALPSPLPLSWPCLCLLVSLFPFPISYPPISSNFLLCALPFFKMSCQLHRYPTTTTCSLYSFALFPPRIIHVTFNIANIQPHIDQESVLAVSNPKRHLPSLARRPALFKPSPFQHFWHYGAKHDCALKKWEKLTNEDVTC
jgi:hypothetical protein